jgi:hypothetical protein
MQSNGFEEIDPNSENFYGYGTGNQDYDAIFSYNGS